jgi:hypothetical protein
MIFLIIILLLFSLLSLATLCVMGGPRIYDILTLSLSVILLWAYLQFNWWSGLLWFSLYGGGKAWLFFSYSKRVKGTNSGQSGAVHFLSFVSVGAEGKRPLVFFLPPLKGISYWLGRKATVKIPQAGNRPASELVIPFLNQIYGASRGFRLDTRQMPSAKGPALEIRCD